MRSPLPLILLCAALTAALAACSRKTDVRSTIVELEAAFPSAAANAPVAAPSAEPQPQASVASVPELPADANELVRTAIAAARAEDYAGGVIALQSAQELRGVTAEQVMAVQRTKQALVAELQRRAANGDPTALAQLKAIEKTRSQ